MNVVGGARTGERRDARRTAACLLAVTAAAAVLGVGMGLPLAGPAGAAGEPAVTTVVGTGSAGFAGDGGPAASAKLDGPSGIAVDTAGDLFVADTDNCRVREVPATDGTHYGIAMQAHRIYTVAGAGCGGGDGSVGYPTAVAVDGAGTLFVADASGNRVFEVPADGGRTLDTAARAAQVTAVAGTGTAGSTGDGGPATAAELDGPAGLTVDAAGDLFIADTENCRVREVPATAGTHDGLAVQAHRIYTVAGTGTCGTGGFGGPATQAQLLDPTAVAVDPAGDLFVADRGGGVVLEEPVAGGTHYGATIGAGDLGTVAGMPLYGSYLVDGESATGLTAELNSLEGVAVGPGGELVATDTAERAIREVPATSGHLFGRAVTAGDLYTVVGGIPSGYNDDKTRWIVTKVTNPFGVAFDARGDLFFSDQGTDQVRELRP